MKKTEMLKLMGEWGNLIECFLQRLRDFGYESTYEKITLTEDYFNLDECDKLPINVLHPGFQWLQEIIKSGAFKQLILAWREQSEMRWKRDFLWDHDDHRHMKLLHNYVRILLQVLRGNLRPDLFKKTKRNAAIKRAK